MLQRIEETEMFPRFFFRQARFCSFMNLWANPWALFARVNDTPPKKGSRWAVWQGPLEDLKVLMRSVRTGFEHFS